MILRATAVYEAQSTILDPNPNPDSTDLSRGITKTTRKVRTGILRKISNSTGWYVHTSFQINNGEGHTSLVSCTAACINHGAD